MSAREDAVLAINKLDDITFRIGYFFPQDTSGPPVIGLRINEHQFYLRLDQALGLANIILQSVHRAETLDFAMHTHMALTHNQSQKRKTEFLDAVNALIAREDTNHNLYPAAPTPDDGAEVSS